MARLVTMCVAARQATTTASATASALDRVVATQATSITARVLPGQIVPCSVGEYSVSARR
jgi:hypothetical protein